MSTELVYILVYDGKVITYNDDRETNTSFRSACQRVADNSRSGGFIVTPSRTVFEISPNRKMAKAVTGDKRNEVLAEAIGL
jgi:hypothetical protein